MGIFYLEKVFKELRISGFNIGGQHYGSCYNNILCLYRLYTIELLVYNVFSCL